MKYFCECCNARNKYGQWLFKAKWLTQEQTRKEGVGIETKRYCKRCGNRVRGCFSMLKHVGTKAKNILVTNKDFGCEKCYVRFRCYTDEF